MPIRKASIRPVSRRSVGPSSNVYSVRSAAKRLGIDYETLRQPSCYQRLGLTKVMRNVQEVISYRGRRIVRIVARPAFRRIEVDALACRLTIPGGMVTIAEAAEIMGVTERAVHNWLVYCTWLGGGISHVEAEYLAAGRVRRGFLLPLASLVAIQRAKRMSQRPLPRWNTSRKERIAACKC